jgi:hypothetical protein
MLVGGVRGTSPPAATLLGTVYHFWDRPGVLGIQPTESVSVQTGQIVAVALRERFHQQEITEVKRDDAGRLTLKVNLERNDVPLGTNVFLLDSDLSFQTVTEKTKDERSPFIRAIAGGVIHPGRDT